MDNENFFEDIDFEELTKRVREQEESVVNAQNISSKYQYSAVPIEEVVLNIDEYIIPELQEACKYLWNRNLYTYMCSNRDDDGAAYIVLEKTLSKENQSIFEQLHEKYPENFTVDSWRFNRFKIIIPDVSKMTEKEISDVFLNMVRHFIPQDVQCEFYVTAENYLVGCGCYDEIPNPEYEEPDEMPNMTNIDEVDEYFRKLGIPKTIKKFNKSKMKRSFKEYVKENGDEQRTDFETGKVYAAPYFLKKHLAFTQSKESTN